MTAISDKKMALVTGGTRGIGRAISVTLAAAGYHFGRLASYGLIGAACGLVVGLIVAGIFSVAQPFETPMPLIAYAGIVFLFTCFGAWQGGLVGISTENKKLRRFHDDIEAGRYLIVVYAHRN